MTRAPLHLAFWSETSPGYNSPGSSDDVIDEEDGLFQSQSAFPPQPFFKPPSLILRQAVLAQAKKAERERKMAKRNNDFVTTFQAVVDEEQKALIAQLANNAKDA